VTEDERAAFFRALEERLMRPDIRRSAEDVAALLGDGFVEFGASGAIYGMQQVVDGLRREEPAERSCTELRVRMLSDEIALVTYRALRRDPVSGRERHSLRSSIWQTDGGAWRMIFHQGTPTVPKP
jgi:hypothetical protein